MLHGREKWGPKAWQLLHAFSINENHKIKGNKKHNYYIFYSSFIYILPCIICREHYTDILYNINPLEEDKITRIYLKKWVFNTHNIVNKILGKPEYLYKNFKQNSKSINNNDIYYIINIIYINFDYENMSLYKYDQIYNFFINFCLLYPIINIRKKLKELLKDFDEIQTPLEFKLWINNNMEIIKNIICNSDEI